MQLKHPFSYIMFAQQTTKTTVRPAPKPVVKPVNSEKTVKRANEKAQNNLNNRIALDKQKENLINKGYDREKVNKYYENKTKAAETESKSVKQMLKKPEPKSSITLGGSDTNVSDIVKKVQERENKNSTSEKPNNQLNLKKPENNNKSNITLGGSDTNVSDMVKKVQEREKTTNNQNETKNTNNILKKPEPNNNQQNNNQQNNNNNNITQGETKSEQQKPNNEKNQQNNNQQNVTQGETKQEQQNNNLSGIDKTTMDSLQKNVEDAEKFLESAKAIGDPDRIKQAEELLENSRKAISEYKPINTDTLPDSIKDLNNNQDTENQGEKTFEDKLKERGEQTVSTITDSITGNVENNEEKYKEEGLQEAQKLNEELSKLESQGAINPGALKEHQGEIKNLEKEVEKSIKNGWGVQKWATAGGAVFGAIQNYKQALEKWEYECQKAAAEGRPMPPKPSMIGSFMGGAIKGGATGFVAGGIAKKIGPIKDIDKNLKESGRARSIENEKEKIKELAYKKGLSEETVIKQSNKQVYDTLSDYANNIKTGQGLSQDQKDYLARLARSGNAGKEALKKYFPELANIKPSADMDSDYTNYIYNKLNSNNNFSNILDIIKYNYLCFSIIEDIQEENDIEIEELKELYTYYTIYSNETPFGVKEFLLECKRYPLFLEYVKEFLSDKLFEKKLNFSNIINDLYKDRSDMIELYDNYKKIINTTLSKNEFLERVLKYRSYLGYIIAKIRNHVYLHIGINFALKQTEMPDNVNIEGEVINTNNGLPNPAKYMTNKNQNSLDIKNGVMQENQKKIEDRKEQIKKNIEIQNNKNNYAKEQNALLKDKINNLNLKKLDIQKNLNRNISDMTPQQVSDLKQKITDMNLKIQNTRTDTKQKILNYKGTIKKEN